MVDAWQLDSWRAYRDVARLGRKTRLPEKQRQALWAIFARVRTSLRERKLLTQAELYGRLAAHLAGGERPPYDHVVVDEAQDVSVAQLRFVASLGKGRPDALFFAGDLGQRIFQVSFSWRSLGVDIRGRSATLRINYRTSHQIRTQADRGPFYPHSNDDVLAVGLLLDDATGDNGARNHRASYAVVPAGACAQRTSRRAAPSASSRMISAAGCLACTAPTDWPA